MFVLYKTNLSVIHENKYVCNALTKYISIQWKIYAPDMYQTNVFVVLYKNK